MNAVQTSPGSSSVTLEVFDPKGEPLVLGEKDVLASGGEGTAYTFPENPKYLVKIYKENTLGNGQRMEEIRQRIQDMLNLTDCLKMDFLAWPKMPAMNSRGEIIGFAMPKVEGKSFRLFQGGPDVIQKEFPGWTRRELALTALDYVQKIHFLASQGVLVSDFNPANFLVNEQCQVSFIDCDSFQIPGRNGVPHINHTHFPDYSSPELLNHPQLLKSPRTLHQVEFSTALMVFSLMMCGLHPYCFRDPQETLQGGTLQENLRQGLCPLCPKPREEQTRKLLFPQGNWNKLWSWMNFKLKSAMLQTFLEGHQAPEKRATLEELEEALHEFVFLASNSKKGISPQYSMLKPTEMKSHKMRGPNKNKAAFQPFAKAAGVTL